MSFSPWTSVPLVTSDPGTLFSDPGTLFSDPGTLFSVFYTVVGEEAPSVEGLCSCLLHAFAA